MHQQVESMRMVQLGSINIAAALYVDDVALLAPTPTSLQLQVNSFHAFCSAESLETSGDKTLVLYIDTSGNVQLDGTRI